MKLFSLFGALLLAATVVRAADPATFEVGTFTFTRPATWSWVEVSSPMRKAELKVPGEGDITFFHFGPGGGDATSNVQRWFHQFTGVPGAEKTESQTFGQTKVDFASTEGTFASGMPGGPTTPMEHYALLAAILDGPDGLVFVKFTGPAAVVKGAHDPFVEFVKNAALSRK